MPPIDPLRGLPPEAAREIRRVHHALVYTESGLTFSGRPLQQLLDCYQGPLIAYSADRLRDNYRNIAGAFEALFEDVQVCFALKCCYFPACAAVLAREGAWVEVMSDLELQLAQEAGFNTDRTVLNGLAWSAGCLERCAQAPPACINVDSLADVDALIECAQSRDVRFDVGIRIAPWETQDSTLLALAGGKLGLELGGPELDAVVRRLGQTDHLRVRGLMAHQLTHCADPRMYRAYLEAFGQAAHTLRDTHGIQVEVLDIGGGFETRFLMEAQGERIETFAEITAEVLGELEANIRIEPGRYVAADAAVGITRVSSSKVTSQGKWLFTELATNALIPLSTIAYHPLPLTIDCAPEDWESVNITDSVCAATMICREAWLPPACTALALLNCGAYTLVFAHPWGFPLPTVLLLDGEQVEVLTSRDQFAQRFALCYGLRPAAS